MAAIPEKEWVGLLEAIAAGEMRALHAVYERTHHLVFTLAIRITNSRDTAEEITLGVFNDVWHRAATYDPAAGSVVAWIMTRARRQELETLYPIIESLAVRPTDILWPSASLWERLARQIAEETGREMVRLSQPRSVEPEWLPVGSGISCQMLATDTEKRRATMLVRLALGAEYPPHRHAGVEELYMLHGELFVDDRRLYPGDYLRSEASSVDCRVWSETGCTGILITSLDDALLINPDLTGVHVIVVDDNEDALDIFGSYLGSYLRHVGAVVTVARNGADALRLLEHARAHVIVTDLSMPGMDGVEFVSRLRGHRDEADAPTPVIAITAFPENYLRETMHELGFRSYLVKPANPERIAREVLAVHNYIRAAGDAPVRAARTSRSSRRSRTRTADHTDATQERLDRVRNFLQLRWLRRALRDRLRNRDEGEK
jgi:CheY-like chemotaxis protein